MTDRGPLRFRVESDDVGLPLELIVRSRVGAATDEIIARGGVWVGDARIQDTSLFVPEGAEITVSRPPTGRYDDVTITDEHILYEDDWLVALNKQQGWYAGMVPWDVYGNAAAALGRYLRNREGGEVYLHMAHQLDRDTSGVLLFSRKLEANAPLQAAFRDRTTSKQYLCVCAGTPPDGSFEVQTGHARGKGGRFRVYPLAEVGALLPNGKPVKFAYTQFTTIQQFDGAALVEANLLTGRTHQIRLHLAHLGYPLLGDARHGGPTKYQDQPLAGHLLHALRLTLPHPASQEAIAFAAPLPEHFRRVLGNQ